LVKGRGRRLRTAALLSLIPGLLGVALVFWPATASLESRGLDLLFLMRGPRAVPADVCVVAIDEDTYWLKEVEPGTWPRGLHGELVRILAREGAGAVAFDVLFEGESDPEQDAAFASGIAAAANVVLGATVESTDDPRFRQTRLIEPHALFAEAAAGIGDVSLPEDPDGAIRHTWLMHDEHPGLGLAAYEVATGDRSYREEVGPRLINYYGPPRTIRTVSLYQALEPAEHLPPGFFKDKIVFVGASLVAAAGAAEVKDSFRTPFYGGAWGNTYGVEIHATLAANLLEKRRVDVVPPAVAALALLLLPLAATLVFLSLRPLLAVPALIVFSVAVWVSGYFLFSRADLWHPVIIPSIVQIPLAYVVCLIWYYLTTVREREKIRRAFTFYLSPSMIKRVTESPEGLNLGGEEVVGTAMFTDIKGFTSIAEGRSAPQTAALLNEYFSEATRHVFDTEGTLIKYIGDAIFAIWGAPVPLADHATRACHAAIGMTRLDAALAGRPAGALATRVGVHTGTMLVGNLGSSQRFDYTAIGDTINLAARLEGINKQFDTRALISDETLSQSDGSLVVRRIGRVQVVGRTEPVVIHELLGLSGEVTSPDQRAIERFERALLDYGAKRFGPAAEGFLEVIALCDGADGPSRFYLQEIGRLERDGAPDDWEEVIRLTVK